MSNAEIICADKRMIKFADTEKKIQCSHSVDGVLYICIVAVEHSMVLHLLSGFLLQYNKKAFFCLHTQLASSGGLCTYNYNNRRPPSLLMCLSG